MATTPFTTSQGKTMTLNELRVFELKQELEKRGLDKSGIKLALVERLEEVCFCICRKGKIICSQYFLN